MSEKPRSTHKILDEARAVRAETGRANEEGLYLETERRIFQPFFSSQIESQKSTAHENLMQVTETELDGHGQEQLALYIGKLEEREGAKGNFSDQKNWRLANELQYKFGETEFDIFSYLPEDYKILFCPSGELHTGSVDIKNKIIYIPNEMSSLGDLATILHEVGHVKDFEHLEKLGLTEFTEGGDEYENKGAEVLRKEREASLFALRKMWGELRKDEQTKKDILLFLKNIAYNSYCDGALGTAATTRMMGHHSPYDTETDMVEELERDRYDAWEKFRKSDEYQAWKNIEEFSQLENYEEYGAWSSWIEETGKANDPQFLAKYFGYEE